MLTTCPQKVKMAQAIKASEALVSLIKSTGKQWDQVASTMCVNSGMYSNITNIWNGCLLQTASLDVNV